MKFVFKSLEATIREKALEMMKKNPKRELLAIELNDAEWVELAQELKAPTDIHHLMLAVFDTVTYLHAERDLIPDDVMKTITVRPQHYCTARDALRQARGEYPCH
ncbi:hypothetical protein [Vibrio sp. SCSIO 43137]|uniref:hypothetical protein n=1 Tax=Vibrio sp. SCSIO 43137 TaxID=3021011 RepID=UPI0023082005|nr:hypothetical protein [Vibrio sp. SCSIO 43137]WCE28437.1 hypothetical protein PK654_08615 [Vibrio sp. SCSIO 43137]